MNNHCSVNVSPDVFNSSVSKETYSLLLNSIDQSFFLVDPELKIVFANDFAIRTSKALFNISIEPGMNVLDLAYPDMRSEWEEMYRQVFSGQPQKTIAVEGKNENRFFFEIQMKPVFENDKVMYAMVSATDVTANKNYEGQLQSAEERWRFALEGANQGVWDWNLQTNEVFYSTSYRRLYGFSEDDPLQTIDEWKALIHPDDKEKMDKALEEHLASPNPFYETKYRIRSKDGSYKWILARGMLIYEKEEEQPSRMIGTHTDITAQVNAEQHYRSLFQANPLPSWIYEIGTGKFLEVNQAAVEQYGFNEDEFLRGDVALVHTKEDRAKVMERLQAEAGIPNHSHNNWKHCRKNGEVVFVDLRINTINYNGTKAKLVVAHDVTLKVRNEQELRKSNDRFLYASKASSEALWEWNFETEEFYASQAYTDIFGWIVNEQRTFDEWHDYIHPGDRQQTIDSYYGALQNREADRWTKEYRYLKSDGSYAHVIDKAFILRGENGDPKKVIGAIQDITLQKKAEDELRESNDRYQYVILATSDIIWDWNIPAGLILWSDNFTKTFGWPLPDDKLLSDDSCFPRFHPDDRDRVINSLMAVVNDPSKTYWQEEFRYLRSDGTYTYVFDRGWVIRTSEGKAVRMTGTMQDISERHYNERLLSLERTIFEFSTNPNLDFKFIITSLLQGIEEIHEDAFTSVLLQRENNTIEPFSAPRLPQAYSDALNGIVVGPNEGSCGSAMARKEIIIVSDIENDPLWTKYKNVAAQYDLKACWSMPIIHSSGKVMGSFAIYYKTKKSPTQKEINTFERVKNIVRVLMENHWSLNQIKEAKERFDIVMKATHDLIWDWNLETNDIYRDEAGLKKVYGTEDNRTIQNIYNWVERIHPADRNRAENSINEILNSQEQNTFELEYRFKKEDGSYSHVYDRGMIIRNANGKPVRMIGAAQDITERKMLEKELLQNELEKQKAINQATVDTQEQERSEIGKELHDNINQVLTTTKLYLDLALSSPELKDELIQKSTGNILNVINEIRQLSRSLMDPSIGDLGLIDSIKDLLENINLTQKLRVKLCADKKLEALLDKNQKLTIFRIIQETVNNALKHARATTVLISITENNYNIHLSIEDDGVGFNMASVKKGAGLKNIENRIYLINGTHTIETAPDKGCRIDIKFPITKQLSEQPN